MACFVMAKKSLPVRKEKGENLFAGALNIFDLLQTLWKYTKEKESSAKFKKREENPQREAAEKVIG